jgi:transcriptional regulator with GAF, ATPase, and Fis domain
MTKVWLYTFDRKVAVQHDLIQGLAAHNIDIYPPDPDRPTGSGIILFSQVTNELNQVVSAWSRAGLHRLLLVASERTSLGKDGPWALLHAGAADILVMGELSATVALIAERVKRWDAIDSLIETSALREHLVGTSPRWIQTLRQITEVAVFSDAPVLLLGETGTGKEQVARHIHQLDMRPDKGDFVVVDCTTIVPELSGSELFGHERGAFTNAVNARDGAFALANRGTLFLDEVGELSLDMQAQLLRGTQEHMYKRVGSNSWRHTAFRLICATNRDLLKEQTTGRFRSDLFYRIAGWVCHLPPLRERIEDIVPLVRHFMQQLRPGHTPPELDAAVLAYLLTRDYPGNVRDLKQLATRMIYRHVGSGPITVGDIPENERPTQPVAPILSDPIIEQAVLRALACGVSLRDIRRRIEDIAVNIAINAGQGSMREAAMRLGVTVRTLQLRRAARRQLPDQIKEAV